MTEGMLATIGAGLGTAGGLLGQGGPIMGLIGLLSVVALALILWKIGHLLALGVWRRGRPGAVIAAMQAGDPDAALGLAMAGRGVRARVMAGAIRARLRLPDPLAREETDRIARRALAEGARGLRALELIGAVAPLLGLLGTVLGMIAAFRALEGAGGQADPSVLAGGIWEALLTTAAGMVVAIPAIVAAAWFEGVTDRLRLDLEDIATRLFAAPLPRPARSRLAAV